jgi:hypothetical protein
LNTNGTTLKQQQRDELEQLVNAYYENGGTISRTASGKVTIACDTCSHRRHVDLSFALTFGRRCRCGAETRIAG